MKRTFATLLLLLTFAAPVSAQEATPEPPSVVIVEPEGIGSDDTVTVSPDATTIIVDTARQNNPVLLIALGIAAILIVFLLGAVVYLAKQGYNSLPPWAQGLVLSNRGWVETSADQFGQRLEDYAKTTPNTLDDELARLVREEVRKGIREFYSGVTPAPSAPPSAQG